jgi:hypothetical protein
VLNLEVVQGSRKVYALQSQNPDGTTPQAGDLLAGDVLTASVWAGQREASIFAPAVVWYTAGGTQTGYSNGQVQVTITAAQSAMLDAAGVYQLQIFDAQSGGDPACIGWCTLTCLPSAGTATQTLTTYTADSDLTFYAPWLESILENNTDQEGFYPQRLRARKWLDRIVVSRARAMQYIWNISTPLTPWGPVEAPNYIIQGYLEAGYILVRDNLIELLSHKAIAYVCEKQISMQDPDPWPSRMQRFHRSANNRLLSYRCELNISSAPSVAIGDATGGGAQALATINATGGVSGILPRQFGSGYTAPTVTMYEGTGSGATATAIVTGGLITGYTITSPGTGYFMRETPDIAFNLGVISCR